ncbi:MULTISPECIES: ABC transporter substrate-binding protein [unclassified Undibacterium]|uniref:MlaC/ttg2D family ABC transporter substrate-binding protein n=2 Tax=Oxalobacteraceae TaxID=75682 RepID=UPI002AC8DE29|nr:MULTISPECIES: ABC transporter substrate-binding protein [unclassified Undibacterium]MEB0139716.1 ABC transporter substrate-binding protein [Undibacterium sp. CCC2.1]MEB0172597.1 ABC transporter substrate-binding protein [Undibacterium sp. CCC1.1]MEB0176422.1 ABC transporter substrate-binding protein [Undibacterium sp. CCC3.4]MEB0215720.1 ABC transporter substrate-binding protein [Undibacterium sp. 5I2]WPX45145.1 ABC transporter substrate-binding protein [Undibacterium sp. CCC3.4]
MKTLISKIFLFAFASLAFMGSSLAAEEAPDQLVKRLSQEILDVAKSDKDIQAGNQKRVYDMVEAKILPYIDFQRMTSLAAGKNWRDATPEQQKQLSNEFRTLLVYTYSGAISQIRDQRVEFKPMRAAPEDTEVEVRSQVIQSRGEPIQLNYRLAKTAGAWKIYDINVLGAWLVETYKGTFTEQISKTGIDGLIKTLAEKNKKLAATPNKAAAK